MPDFSTALVDSSSHTTSVPYLILEAYLQSQSFLFHNLSWFTTETLKCRRKVIAFKGNCQPAGAGISGCVSQLPTLREEEWEGEEGQGMRGQFC